MRQAKYPESVYYTPPQDGPDKADTGAVCEWGDTEGLALSLRGMDR